MQGSSEEGPDVRDGEDVELEALGGRSARCHLTRPDGSEWLVTALEVRDGTAWVSARPLNGTANESEPLERTALGHGDRLEWVAADGSSRWAMRIPTGERGSSTRRRPPPSDGE